MDGARVDATSKKQRKQVQVRAIESRVGNDCGDQVDSIRLSVSSGCRLPSFRALLSLRARLGGIDGSLVWPPGTAKV